MASTTDKLQDPNLSEEEQDAIIGAFVRQHENERLRKRWEEQLSTKHKVTRAGMPVKRKATIRRLGVAVVAIAATLLLLFAVWPMFAQPDGGELLAAYVSEVNVDGTRGEGEFAEDAIRADFLEAFRSGDFKEATRDGENLLALPAFTAEDELNLGKAYLRNNQYDKANAIFRELTGRGGEITADATYFLGLSLLRQGDTTAGLAELRNIKATDGKRLHGKAQKLLEADWE